MQEAQSLIVPPYSANHTMDFDGYNSSLFADDMFNSSQMTDDMTFNSSHVISITCYSLLMLFSAFGNIAVLMMFLSRRNPPRSRVNTMLMHLAIADLMVTFLMMPLEIGWAATVSWRAGDTMCRIMAVCRVFGLFLSSFVLVCISMDRYFAILRPMSISGVDRRGRLMLSTAWLMSFVCSIPQALVFSVQRHPRFPWYEQCLTYATLTTHNAQVLYAIFSSAFMYGIPLFIIIFAYGSIMAEIYRRAQESGDELFRRSSLGFLGKAKTRTLKMTLMIVTVFFICWTPYNIMSVWYWFDKESARKVDQRIQKSLFIFACTNSCMNPIVYGVFNYRRRRHTGGQVRNRLHTFSSTEHAAPPQSRPKPNTQRRSIESNLPSEQLEETRNGQGASQSLHELPRNGCNGNHKFSFEEIDLTV